jgi:hypothetical protein
VAAAKLAPSPWVSVLLIPLFRSPADFGKFIADETEKWARVIRAANIKAE